MEKTDRVKCLDRAIANGAAINDSLFCSLMDSNCLPVRQQPSETAKTSIIS